MTTLERDTALIPEIVAACVCEQHGPPDPAFVLYASHKARTVYASNSRFARCLRGKCGRDYLYLLMGHWWRGYVARQKAT